MGLDMDLIGRERLYSFSSDKKRYEDGYEIKAIEVELGYWRKHPNLHGYIVQTFADGMDECQVIDLNQENIENIIEAIKENRLPPTSGFFFGHSDGSEAEEDLRIFTKALEWLSQSKKDEATRRSIYYQASW